MNPSYWHPGAWVVLAIVAAGVGWWCLKRAPIRVFRYAGLRRLASTRGWLVKFGANEADRPAELAGDGIPAGDDWAVTQPDTNYEILGEHQGFYFHVREQKRVQRGMTATGDPRRRFVYGYTVTVATTPHPFDGKFTLGIRRTVPDWRLALYPAFLEFERMLPRPIGKICREHGLVSVRGEYRLDKRALMRHLAELTAAAHGQMDVRR
jgi:hypothetical protein